MPVVSPSRTGSRLHQHFLPGAINFPAWVVIFILAAIAIPAQSQTLPPNKSLPQISPIAAANNAFAIDLYQKLKDQPGNLFFSPYSISDSLAMTYAGARGQTATEMANVLHFDPAQADVHAAFGQLNKRINEVQHHGRVTLLSANSLWCQKDYPFTRAFLKLVQKDYDAEAQTVDFINHPSAAQNRINSWVARKTDGKIQNLIEKGQLTPATTLILCNAIYFKGKWQTQFDPADTKPAPFDIATNQTVTVPMMSVHGAFAIAFDEEDSVELLEMPYIGNDLSMIILLPANEPSFEHRWKQTPQPPLSELEKKLTAGNLDLWCHRVDGTSPDDATISIPRFTTTQSFDLSEQLKSMGMSSAFNDAADFSGMDGTTNLYISKVLHQAYVKVDEEGTEAAAATAINMMVKGVPELFIADRPFIFLIRDNASGQILFLGRMVDPTK
jgi:serine protease inhibitor